MSVGSSAGGFNQYVLPNTMNLDIDEQDWLAQINQDYIPLSYTTSHSHWILIKIIYKYRYDTGKCSSLRSGLTLPYPPKLVVCIVAFACQASPLP